MTGTDALARLVEAQPAVPAPVARPATSTSTAVSDSTYFADLADRVAVTSQTTLPQEGGLAWSRGPCSRARARADVPDAAGPRTRRRRRRRTTAAAGAGDAQRDSTGSGFTFGRHRGVRALLASRAEPTGDRGVRVPDRRLARGRRRAWFVDARAAVARRHYNLDRRTARDGHDDAERVGADREPRRRARVRARLDSVFGASFVQTLEPRAYLRLHPVPRPERAAGVRHARRTTSTSRSCSPRTGTSATTAIGDANQLTLAVTSRLLDPATGAERFRVAVGQRFYFEDQQVYARQRGAAASASSSDFLLGAEGRLSDAWSLIGPGAVQLRLQRRPSASTSARATRRRPAASSTRPTATRGNSSTRSAAQSELKQFDLSTQWPLSAATGRSSDAGTTRSPTARRWRRWRASSTMATAGRCASSGSG